MNYTSREFIERTLKEMRWLNIQFPYQDKALDRDARMRNAIHCYTLDAITVLQRILGTEENIGEERGSEQLKPCPFCGSKAILLSFNGSIYTVGCQDDLLCPGYVYKVSPVYYGKELAIEAWNRRQSAGDGTA